MISAPPPWLKLGLQHLSISEQAGKPANKTILDYFQTLDRDEIISDEVPWCAAFVGAMLARSGYQATNSLRARSYLTIGTPLSKPKRGAIAIFSRGRNPIAGHVGFVVEDTPSELFILGGNQQNEVNISPYPKRRLLGTRWPQKVSKTHKQTGQNEYSKLFERAVAGIIGLEGEWSDHKSDPGGPTMYGITIKTFADHLHRPLNNATRPALTRQLRAMTKSAAIEIYYHRYWQEAHCAALPAALAFMHFDTAVNQGVKRAIRFLQTAIGCDVDGEFGPLTRAAAKQAEIFSALKRYAATRRAHYASLPHYPTFKKGWLSRVDKVLQQAITIARNSDVATHPTHKETTTMTERQKWWGESLTIWGAIVTALSTVLPALAPLFGFDITAEVIRQFGENVAQLIQIIGGLTGTSMTIYGRLRADTRLGRRNLNLKL